MILKIIGYIIVAMVILIAGYSFFRKSPEKFFKKAKSCHKKGEKYYDLGDPELAKDYYEEAEFHRQKAEELQDNL